MSREPRASMVTSLGSSWLEALLEQHLLVQGGQFTVCACSHKSLDSYRDRHVAEFLGRKHRVAVLPVENLATSVALAAELMSARLGVASPEEWGQAPKPSPEVPSICGFLEALRQAYPAYSARIFSPDAHICDSAYATLTEHRAAEIYLIDGETHMACVCGFENDEHGFESHRAEALVSAGIMYGTFVELSGMARTLHNLSAKGVLNDPLLDPDLRYDFQSAAGAFRSQVGSYATI